MKKILLAVTGGSPQVVTETLYALMVEPVAEQQFIPDEIHLITTGFGRKKALDLLSDQGDNQLARFSQEWQLPILHLSGENIHVPVDGNNSPIEDPNTAALHTQMADFILDKVRGFCSEPNTQVHASIAGGRKTMTFLLGYAMSLYARRQDKLSHVVVNKEFENLREFFFPTKTPYWIDTSHGRKNCQDAKVQLVPLPFVRLRHYLPEHLSQTQMSFLETVELHNTAMEKDAVMLQLDRESYCVICAGRTVQLTPLQYGFYAMMARDCLNDDPDRGFERPRANLSLPAQQKRQLAEQLSQDSESAIKMEQRIHQTLEQISSPSQRQRMPERIVFELLTPIERQQIWPNGDVEQLLSHVDLMQAINFINDRLSVNQQQPEIKDDTIDQWITHRALTESSFDSTKNETHRRLKRLLSAPLAKPYLIQAIQKIDQPGSTKGISIFGLKLDPDQIHFLGEESF